MRLRNAILIGICSVLTAQETQFSVGVSSFNGEAKTPIIQFGRNQFYPYDFGEHYLDLSAWRGELTLWANVELSGPPRIGPSFAGLRKLSLSWERDNLSVMVGDLYGQIGRGLGLNMWENQNMDWDSTLRGAWLKTKLRDRFRLDLIAGKATGGRHLGAAPGIDPRRRDFSEDETIGAVSAKMENLFPGSNIGGYLIFMNGKRSWFTSRESNDLEIVTVTSVKPGFLLEYAGNNFDLYFEGVARSASLPDVDSLYSETRFMWHHYERQTSGRGLYLAGSYYPGNWGVTVELKDYLFDRSPPEQRAHLPFRLGRSSLVTGPPSGFREHSSTLLARTPHIMDLDDELGFQIEFNRQLNENLFLLLNYSRSSRHTAFAIETDESFRIAWQRSDHERLFVPSSDYGFYPFHEGYAELTYRYDPLRLDFTAGLAQSSEVLIYRAHSFYRAGASEWLSSRSKKIELFERRNLFSIPTELTIGLPWNLFVSFDMEHQWEALAFGSKTSFTPHGESKSDSVKAVDIDVVPYYYRYGAVTIGKASRFSFSFLFDHASKTKTGDIFNSDPEQDNALEDLLRRNQIDLANKWFGIETTLYVTSSTVVSFFYGSVQGGLKCENGICVYVPGLEDASMLSFTANF